MNILLTGIRGSGKSTIGALLAKKLEYSYVEFDQQVLVHTGFQTVKDVYAQNKYLWAECELELSKDLGNADNMVIATGGGFIENKLNISYFKDQNPHTVVIYLKAKPETIARRNVALASEREKTTYQSMLSNVKKIQADRSFLYDLYADIVIETDDKEPASVLAEISQKLRSI